MKKLLAVLLASVQIFLSGCAAVVESSPIEETPPEFVERIYEGLADKSLSFLKVYENCLSDTSKAVFESADYAELEKARCAVLYEKDMVVESVESISDAQLDGGITRVRTTIQCTAGENPSVLTCEDYVQESDAGFRLLYNGILTKKTYTMNAAHESNKIHFTSLTLFTCVDKVRMEANLMNDSMSRFSIGADDGAVTVLQTDAGEYSFTFPQAYTMGSEKQISVDATYSGAKGNVQKLSLQNIYTLDVFGNRIETDEGNTYSVSLQ